MKSDILSFDLRFSSLSLGLGVDLILLKVLAKPRGLKSETLCFSLACFDRLELKDVELSALLRVVDPLDQTVVPLLEGIHFEDSLLLDSRSGDLLLGHRCLFTLGASLLLSGVCLGVTLLCSLNGLQKLLLLS